MSLPVLRDSQEQAVQQIFEPNAFYEKILDLRRTNPRDFDSLSPAVKISLGAYEAQKREAERLQAIHDEPEAGSFQSANLQTERKC